MDIFDSLRDDHLIIRNYLAEIDRLAGTQPDQRVRLFGELSQFLGAHMQAEQAVFYEAMREHDDTGALAREGEVEHGVATALLPIIASLPPEDPYWRAHFVVLKQGLEHHLDEEERELFKLARKAIDPERGAALLGAMDNARATLLDS